MSTDLHSWLDLWQRTGATSDGSVWHRRLLEAYSEPTRHYHTGQHLGECLAALDNARTACHIPNADAIELALWFHDAVYDPQAADNEKRSADMAGEALQGAGLESRFIAEARRLVMCTQTHKAAGHADAQWMVDVDLSILGSNPVRFLQYEAQIRAEYAWVPTAVYTEKRAEILTGFLARERIFLTEFFHQRYEHQAWENLAGLIATLRETR